MQKFFKSILVAASLLSLSAQAQETTELTVISDGTEEIALSGLAGHGLKIATSIEINKQYVIVSRFSGKCLDIVDHSNAEDAEVQQWDCHYGDNQKFFLRPEYKFGNKLVSVESGHELGFAKSLPEAYSPDQNGRLLIQHGLPYVNHFKFTPSVLAGVYTISTKTGCLDITDWNPNNGNRIQQWECHGGINQQWIVLEKQ